MKLKQLGIYAACALVLTACGGEKKSADDFKDVKLSKESSVADSVSYLMGNLMGIQTQQILKNDSTIDEKSFNEGYYAALGLVKLDNMSYNQGLMMGLQAAGQLADMKANYDIQTSIDALASGYAAGVKEKTDESTMMKLQTQASAATDHAMSIASAKVLDKYAKGKNYKKQGNTYYNIKKAGDGTQVSKGSQTGVKLRLFDTKGKEIMPGSGDQASPVTVGQSPMPMLDAVLPLVKEGASFEILTTGAEVFQGRTPQGVKPMDVYVISVEVVPYTAEPAPMPGAGAATGTQAGAAAPAQVPANTEM